MVRRGRSPKRFSSFTTSGQPHRLPEPSGPREPLACVLVRWELRPPDQPELPRSIELFEKAPGRPTSARLRSSFQVLAERGPRDRGLEIAQALTRERNKGEHDLGDAETLVVRVLDHLPYKGVQLVLERVLGGIASPAGTGGRQFVKDPCGIR